MSTERRRLVGIKRNLVRRAQIYEAIRAFFREEGFLEVETPVRLREIAPEGHILPFHCDDWYLSTSPELHMKRLLAAGYDCIFQFSRSFRRQESGRWHNPEFTMLEWYRAGADDMKMMEDTENLVLAVSQQLGYSSIITYQKQSIDLSSPWPKFPIRQIFKSAAGYDPVLDTDPVKFDMALVEKVIPSLPTVRPAIIMDYPASMASLSRLKADEQVAERAEVFIAGLELANAFSELCDPKEQTARFEEERALIKKEQGRDAPMPDKFLAALPEMPASGGIALGVDRLVMLFCDAASIDEVMPFTEETA